MRIVPTLFIALIGSVALAGVAAAQSSHTMTVRLPDGALEQIQYTGDTPPQVAIIPAPTAFAFGAAPVWTIMPPASFANIQRIMADADRDAAAMWQQAQALASESFSGANGPISIDVANAPPGTRIYAFSSTDTGNGVCTQSTEITSVGPNGQPHVVSHRSGNCSGTSAAAGASPDDRGIPHLLPAAVGPTHPTLPLREVAWNVAR